MKRYYKGETKSYPFVLVVVEYVNENMYKGDGDVVVAVGRIFYIMPTIMSASYSLLHQ